MKAAEAQRSNNKVTGFSSMFFYFLLILQLCVFCSGRQGGDIGEF